MTALKLLVFLNLIMVFFNFVFLIRTFFINYKGSNKLYKNVIIISFLVIGIFISASCVIEGKMGIDIMKALENPQGFSLTEKKIQIYQDNLNEISNRIPYSTIIAYVVSILAYLLFADVQTERKKKTTKTGDWDYDKIKRNQNNK